MSDPYSILARFYDRSMDVDYEEWVTYLLALGLRHHHLPSKILDLGCGTGNLTLPLARRGYELTGVDLSQEMVAVATRKAQTIGEDIRFYVGDMRDFYVPQLLFDTVISGCDVLNHLAAEADLVASFETAYKLLKVGGLWLFDLNSAYKLQNIYGNESYAELQDDFGYFWDNSYDSSLDICTMDLTFFVSLGEGLYERRTERHRQRLWTPRQIAQICDISGFYLRACYNFLTFEPYTGDSHRWQFVVEKV